MRDELLNRSVVYLSFDLISTPLIKLSPEVGLLVFFIYSELYICMGFDCGSMGHHRNVFASCIAINNYVIKGSEKKNTQTALECMLIVIKGSRI